MKRFPLPAVIVLSCALHFTCPSRCSAMLPVELPYAEDFCCTLPNAWTYQSSNEGRIRIRDGRLLLDDWRRGSEYSLNQAILHANLQNYEDVVLRFHHTSHADETRALPETFSGSANGDGLALSVDGVNWFRVASFQSGVNTINLSQFMADKGITPNANTRLNFMQYDNFPANIDGRSFDDVKMTGTRLPTGGAVPVSLPYLQAFNSKPDAGKGWVYESTNEGRIEVVNGVLRLDDSRGNPVYSQNNAVLHLDLSTASNPVLRFRARESRDERNPLPQTFTDAKGDGVALSANGEDWVRLVSLSHADKEWTEYALNLAEFGMAFGAEMRIAFMQYDNYSHPSDGWEFDDIEIREEDVEDVPPLQPPLVPPTIIPAGADLAEAPLGYWSIGSADTADGLEPNNRQSRDTFWKLQGDASIQFNTDSGFETRVGFPTTRDANWDLRTVRSLRFNLFSRNEHPITGPEISLVSGEERFIYTPGPGAITMNSALENWVTVEIPIAGSAAWRRTQIGTPSFAEIDALEIMGDPDEYGFSFWIDDVRFDPPLETVLPGLTAPDLTVGWIERTPKYQRYNVVYPGDRPQVANPGKRWPDLGEPVTWTAHIANRGRVRASTFTVNWWVDNAQVQSTRHEALQPGGTTDVDLLWSWNGSQEIRAEIVPDFPGERTVLNNSLSIDSEAMTYGFIVEQSTFNLLNNTPNRLGSTSCEDWLNTVLDDMDRRFALSIYDFAPNGAEMRIRLDKLTLVPDSEEFSPFAPRDLEVDGGWLFPALSRGEYQNFNILYNNALTHELMHQLGVIDTYQFNVERNFNEVDGLGYGAPYPSLMGGAQEEPFAGNFLGPHTVHGINSSIGYRRGHFGEYLYDLPQSIRIQVFNATGSALSGAVVKFYQRDRNAANMFVVDNVPEFTLTTGPSGLANLPNRPITGGNLTTATGHTLQANPFGLILVPGLNGVFLMEVSHEGRTFTQPFTLAEANVAYARGITGTYTKRVDTDF